MIDIIKVNPSLLRDLTQKQTNPNRTYFDKSKMVQQLYWNRLKYMIKIIKDFNAGKVLDLGCGEGVFLPTLSNIYENVSGIDLDISISKETIKYFSCRNVKLYKENFLTTSFPDNEFDLVFAASVLEHFEDLDCLFIELKRILSKGGFLIFSSPTETFLYKTGRKIFKYTKPKDHYYSVFQIRNIARKYLRFYRKRNGPFKILPGLLSAYIIYAFKKDDD